ELNFYKGNKALKLLAFLWILQNAFMIVSTAYRNNLYINEYSLTYKRIGVYIWLLLAMIGLMTTFLKIFKRKSNWFLFRSNGWLFYAVLVISSLINWDVILSDFNINRAEVKHKPLDRSYLISLSEKNLPQLLTLSDKIKDSVNTDDSDFSSLEFSRGYESAPLAIDTKPALHNKLYRFLEEMQSQQWQSFCFEKKRVHHDIFMMNKSITEISLQNYYLTTLKPLDILSNLQTLYFSNNHLEHLEELKMFPTLENLYLSSNQIDSLDFFPRMDLLKTLSLSTNNIKKLDPLKYLSNLTFLDLSYNQSVDFKTMPALKSLSVLLANNTYINDFTPFEHLPALKELSFSNSLVNNKNSMPSLPKLERLTIQNDQITCSDTALFMKLASYTSLAYLNLSDNQLENLYPLTSEFGIKKTVYEKNKFSPSIPSLRSLDISRNNIHSLYFLFQYKSLEELFVSGNPLTDIETIDQLTNLKTLSIDNCGLRNINFVRKLSSLQVLNISNNNFTDYSPLSSLKDLKQLTAGPVTKAQWQQLKKILPKTKIYASVIN
ncbi:MAG: leucine-rich repeat domain-containing protein, partial [Bacteroidia bacterium]